MTAWLIYGANGYTGELIAREAVRRGLTPVLAGRARDRIEPLAAELGLESRVFDLADPGPVAGHLEGVRAVLHCAGPFSATAAPMIEACLRAGAHYLDITGEISVFEHAYAQHDRAADAGVVVCPGVGFDVIPTDCVAATLYEALPDAVRLALGFDTRAGMSAGTTKTSIESLGAGGKVRRDGVIVTVPLGGVVRRIDFGNGEKTATAIPWGDVASAYRSTGIPSIEVFVPTSPRRLRSMRFAGLARPLLGLGVVQGAMKRRAGAMAGPDEASRERSPAYVWGEAANAAGETRTARIRTANGYSLTVAGALEFVTSIVDSSPAGGAYTPSQLLGADVVTRLPGSGPLVVE